jgi:glycosyltransferase 2 family protein
VANNHSIHQLHKNHSNDMHQISRFQSIKNIVFILGTILGWAFFSWQVIRGVASVNQQQPLISFPYLLFIAFLGMLIYIGIQVNIWRLILIKLGSSINWPDAASGYIFTFISRYIPGTIWGYFNRSEWLFRKHKVPFRISNNASLFEVVITLAAALTILIITSINFETLNFTQLEEIIGAILISICIWMIIALIGKFSNFSFFNKNISNPFLSIPFRSWVTFQFLYLLQWFGYGMITFLVIAAVNGLSLSINTIITGINYATFAFTFAWVVGFFVPFIPGGIGVREFFLAILLTRLFNIDSEASVVISIFLRIIGSLGEFTWWVWSIIYIKRNQKIIDRS